MGNTEKEPVSLAQCLVHSAHLGVVEGRVWSHFELKSHFMRWCWIHPGSTPKLWSDLFCRLGCLRSQDSLEGQNSSSWLNKLFFQQRQQRIASTLSRCDEMDTSLYSQPSVSETFKGKFLNELFFQRLGQCNANLMAFNTLSVAKGSCPCPCPCPINGK